MRFLAIAPRDAHFFRSPGLFAFVHRGAGEHRTLLYVDQSENLAANLDGGHRLWGEALKLGFDELNVVIPVDVRIDRLQLRTHIIKRCTPLLNLVEAGPRRADMPSAEASVRQRA